MFVEINSILFCMAIPTLRAFVGNGPNTFCGVIAAGGTCSILAPADCFVKGMEFITCFRFFFFLLFEVSE